MKLTDAESMRAHLLIYDIPTTVKMPNPSGFLWSIGARLNLSCWVVPDAEIVKIPLNDWRSKGCIVELVRFDERDGETIMRLARESLERHLRDIRDYTERCMAGALKKLDACATGDEDVLKKRKASTQTITWRAKRDLERAHECALTFDLLADVQYLFDAARLTVAAQEKMAFDAVQKKLTAGQREAS